MEKSLIEVFEAENENKRFLINLIELVKRTCADGYDRSAIYISICDLESKRLAATDVGIGSVEKMNKYHRLVYKKMATTLVTGKRSSFTRNPDREEHGGAVKYRDIVVACSGMSPDDIDEAISLTYAIYLYEIKEGDKQKDLFRFYGDVWLKLKNECMINYRHNSFLTSYAAKMYTEVDGLFIPESKF